MAGQIHFMVDFENTRSRGLQGADYLLPEDAVTIFYSQACMKIERRWFYRIQEAGCEFHICKLQKQGKNALDFYIASRIGELYGSGYTGKTAIVSSDTGFKAIRDYWKDCAAVSRDIILRPDIEQCIAASGENSYRQRQICKGRQEISLENEYQQYIEHQRLRRKLEDSFGDTEYAGLIEQVMSMVEIPKSRKILYLDSVKQFGREKGLKIYHKVSQIL